MRNLAVAVSFSTLLIAGSGMVLAQESPAPAGKAPAPVMKLTAAECQAIWQKADAANAGSLTISQAKPYVTSFKAVDVDGNGAISSSEFLSGCGKGLAHDSVGSGASSGTSGEGGAPLEN